jgi:hypothetical protein
MSDDPRRPALPRRDFLLTSGALAGGALAGCAHRAPAATGDPAGTPPPAGEARIRG